MLDEGAVIGMEAEGTNNESEYEDRIADSLQSGNLWHSYKT